MNPQHSFFVNEKGEIFLTTMRKKINPIAASTSSAVLPGWVASENFNFFDARPPVYKKSVILKTMPFMMEEYLIEPLENYHFTIIMEGRQFPVFVYAAIKNKISEWMQLLDSVNISPSTLYPDIFALPYEDNVISVFASKTRCLARTDKYQGFCGKGKLFFDLLVEQAKETNKEIKIYAADIDVIPQSQKNKVTENRVNWLDMLNNSPFPPSQYSLLHGEYYVEKNTTTSFNSLKTAGVIAVLFAVLVLGTDLVSLMNYKQRTDDIRFISGELYKQMFNQDINDINQLRNRVLLNMQEISGVESSDPSKVWSRLQEISGIIRNCNSCNILKYKMAENSKRTEITIEARSAEPIPRAEFTQRGWKILAWRSTELPKEANIPQSFSSSIILEKR